MLLLSNSITTDLERMRDNPYEFARAYDKKREDIIAECNMFMGNRFARGYIYQLFELQTLLSSRQEALFKFTHNGPQELVPYYQNLVNDTLEKINSLSYAQTPEEVDYSKAYRLKFEDFAIDYNSKHTEAVLNFDDLYFRV